jgi:malate permease and related proteins
VVVWATVVERILQIILPVFAIVAAGWGYGRAARPNLATVNRMNVEVFTPALVLSALSRRSFDLAENGGLVLACLLVIAGAGLVGWAAARALRVDPRTFVPPIMFNNSGNMGLPLALLAFGEARLPGAVALFVTTNLLHFTLGLRVLRGAGAEVVHLLRSPMVLATAAGLAISATGIALLAWLALALEMTGDVAVPLMLFTLGVRMTATTLEGWHVGLAGGVLRPVVGVALAMIVAPLLRLDATPSAMLTLYASLPPAVLNFMLAEQYRQEPQQVASIVLVGHLVSLAAVPAALALALR